MRVLEDTKTAHIVGQQLLGQVIQERDESRKEASRLHEAGTGLIAQLNAAQADVERLTVDLKQAEENNYGLMTELQNMRAGLEVATEERDEAEEKCQKLHAENEGLRAGALAYPPQRLDLQQYVNLKADYDRQVIVIETLQEGLKRTETLLVKAQAQAQHIDDRLKGFLSVISQLADQAQDLIP